MAKKRAASDTVYKVVEVIGTSEQSWEDAARKAVQTAAETLRDLRIAEISQLDLQMQGGKIAQYRARVKLSFKYEGGD